jgi:predicted transcriptional regulator
MQEVTDQAIKELASIRKLLILSLLNAGLSQSQVAGALDIDRSAISRMFRKGTLLGLGKDKRDE